jgi:Skp family chaperone for outer membrane proteins
MFQLPGQEPFLTTVGKLNFFRWAIEKGVLDYIKANFKTIEKEMNATQRELQKLRRESDKAGASTGSSSGSAATESTTTTATSKSSTRRRTRLQAAAAAATTTKIMQKHDLDIQVTFD